LNYYLLTGATGLLGQYILRDALRAGLRMAVLARGDASAPASQRIDALLRHFEGELGFALPRPVVLEGDLRHPHCGLSPDAIAWIGEHCTAVVHNAASITFHTAPSGEPRLTNVDGTRHLLEICEQAGVRHWHQVSTAYVCGLRHGAVLESELDVGQQFGNDYERSKLAAEQMVRQASHLDQVTVLRPAIIVGDSQTGYTSTFHGLYAPLQLLLPLAGAAPATMAGLPYFEKLGMRGEEGKNFVLVDWVAAVLVHIVANRQHHGQTYHLTADRPVPVQLIDATLGEVILSRPGSKSIGPVVGKGAIDRRFREASPLCNIGQLRLAPPGPTGARVRRSTAFVESESAIRRRQTAASIGVEHLGLRRRALGNWVRQTAPDVGLARHRRPAIGDGLPERRHVAALDVE